MREGGRSFFVATAEKDLPQQADGIICSTDHYLQRVLRHVGVESPVRLAGFDNVSFLRSLRSDILTVDHSTDRLAAECMNYFLRRDYQSVIPHRIVGGE